MKHCSKCDGYGYLNGFSHVKGGVCFRCGGKRTITDKEIQEEKERNKEKNRLKRIRETYPEKIEHQKKLLADVENNDAPFESEEQKEVVMAYIGRCKKRIESMKKELAEATEAKVHQ